MKKSEEDFFFFTFYIKRSEPTHFDQGDVTNPCKGWSKLLFQEWRRFHFSNQAITFFFFLKSSPLIWCSETTSLRPIKKSSKVVSLIQICNWSVFTGQRNVFFGTLDMYNCTFQTGTVYEII